jgi:calcineurin-like phosphoesterase family protein
MKLDSRNQLIGFTSDYHLYHKNIIEYASRPFSSVMEMNEDIRDKHNQIFDKDSIIFNLGDALLLPSSSYDEMKKAEGFLSTFKGKIYYLPGNHERNIDIVKSVWTVLPPLYELEIRDLDKTIVLCHYCLRSWNKAHHGAWHLYGHSHAKLLDDKRELLNDHPNYLCLDVGVDGHEFYPWIMAKIKDFMKTKTFIPELLWI